LVEGDITKPEARRKRLELDELEADLRRTLEATPTNKALTDLPRTPEELLAAWEERGIDYQRTLIELTIESITVKPAGKPSGRRFDPDRLRWRVRA
jgi:hypothetical protein